MEGRWCTARTSEKGQGSGAGRARRRVRPLTGAEKTDYLQWTSRWLLRLGDGGASQAIGILCLIPLSQRRTSSGGSSHSRVKWRKSRNMENITGRKRWQRGGVVRSVSLPSPVSPQPPWSVLPQPVVFQSIRIQAQRARSLRTARPLTTSAHTSLPPSLPPSLLSSLSILLSPFVPASPPCLTARINSPIFMRTGGGGGGMVLWGSVSPASLLNLCATHLRETDRRMITVVLRQLNLLFSNNQYLLRETPSYTKENLSWGKH